MQVAFSISLWLVVIEFVFLAQYHIRYLWNHGGRVFLEATYPTDKLLFIGTALCLLSIPFAIVSSPSGEPSFYLMASTMVTAIGLLVLCPLSITIWRRAIDKIIDIDEETKELPALESDGPLNSPKQATEKLNRVVDCLSSLLCNTDTAMPLIVGITGRWGSGKSSLMNMVKRDISGAGSPCVWFNAWHHQRETHLFAALMEAIHNEVGHWSFERYVSFRFNLLRVRIAQAPMRSLLVLALLLAVALGVWVAVVFFEANNYYGGSVSSLVSGTLALCAVAKGYRYFGKVFGVVPAVLASGIGAQFKLTRFRKRLGFRHEFGTAFRQVCQALRERRLVIIIDDLDRCGPEQVVTILEAVNFLTASGDCVIVLGMDEDRVMEAVGLYFSDIGATGAEAKKDKNEARRIYARKYLEKLVGLWVPVPAISSEELRSVRIDSKKNTIS